MPSLFRFLAIAGTLSAIVFAGLYALAVVFEPVPKEVSKPVPGVKIRKSP
jgi:hypothetical protein